MNTAEHYEKFKLFAEALGVDSLTRILPEKDPEVIAHKLLEDEHLNNIPLRKWDACHSYVVALYRQSGMKLTEGWSLSYTVCVLKHVAIYNVAGSEPPKKEKQ